LTSHKNTGGGGLDHGALKVFARKVRFFSYTGILQGCSPALLYNLPLNIRTLIACRHWVI